MSKQIRLCRLTYRETRRLDLRWLDAQNAGPLTAIVCPCFIGSRSYIDVVTANGRGCQLLLAIQTYKHRFASYPSSLAELKAKENWNLGTEDPFSGKDFIYKRTGKGFLLYSVGPNLKDDGGVKCKQDSYRKGDIVWRTDHNVTLPY